MPDDVQGDQPQGGEATEGGLFDSYIQAVPEEARESVASYLKDAEKNVNSRLQEAAELQKSLGPYKDVQGLSDYPPDQLSELLGWHQQVVSSPEAYQQWLTKEAEAAGFTKAEAEELQDAEESGAVSSEKIQEIIDQRLKEQLAPLQEQQSELAQARMIDTIEQDIHSEWSRLESEHGEKFSEQTKAMILDLGINHEGEGSWVQAGYDRLKEVHAEAQKAFVTDKAGQPGTPMSAGGSEAFKPTTDFSEAREQMRERWRQMQS